MQNKISLPTWQNCYLPTKKGIIAATLDTIKFKLNGEFVVSFDTPEGQMSFSEYFDAYADSEAYERGNSLNYMDHWTRAIEIAHIIGNYVSGPVLVFHDGKIEYKNIDSIEFIGSYKNDNFIIESVEPYYADNVNVWAYNDYVEVDKDGNEIVHKSIKSALELTDTQNKLVDDLKKLIDKCKKAGLAFAVDYDDMSMTVFNTLGCDVESNYGPDSVDKADMRGLGKLVYSTDIYLNSEYVINATLKTK